MKKISTVGRDIVCTEVQNTAGLYAIEERFGYNVYYFDEDFIHLVRYAMSSDCISEMSVAQEAFYELFILNVMNGIYDEATDALSKYIYKLTSCQPLYDGVECGQSLTHTYTACS